jgi:hypothetical protein
MMQSLENGDVSVERRFVGQFLDLSGMLEDSFKQKYYKLFLSSKVKNFPLQIYQQWKCVWKLDSMLSLLVNSSVEAACGAIKFDM